VPSNRFDLAGKYIQSAARMSPSRGIRLLRERARHQLVRPRTLIETRVPLPGGTGDVWLRPGTSDWPVFEQIFLHREYDTAGTRQHDEIVKRYEVACASGRPPLIIDLGANVGLSSVLLARTWPSATVVAVEPDENNFRMLRRNVSSLSNIAPIHSGIWDTQTTLAVADATADPWMVSLVESRDPRRGIRAITVQDILARYDHTHIFIAKIDIEGAERELFRSNHDWLDRVDLVMIELHDWLYPGQRRSNNFLRAVMRVDREVFINGEHLFCLRVDKTHGDDRRALCTASAVGTTP
jgi:FkbM family methyltransferase